MEALPPLTYLSPIHSQLPPTKPSARLGDLLKLNGLRGGKRDVDSHCNQGVSTLDLNVTFCIICFILFLLHGLWRKRPCIENFWNELTWINHKTSDQDNSPSAPQP